MLFSLLTPVLFFFLPLSALFFSFVHSGVHVLVFDLFHLKRLLGLFRPFHHRRRDLKKWVTNALICGIWHLIPDTWYLTPDIWYLLLVTCYLSLVTYWLPLPLSRWCSKGELQFTCKKQFQKSLKKQINYGFGLNSRIIFLLRVFPTMPRKLTFVSLQGPCLLWRRCEVYPDLKRWSRFFCHK